MRTPPGPSPCATGAMADRLGRVRLTSAWMVGLALVGCSGSSGSNHGGGDAGGDAGEAGGGGDAPAGPTVQQACNDWAMAICTEQQKCTPFPVQVFYGDVPGCTTRTALQCSASYALAGSNGDTSKLEACAQAYGAQSCQDFLGLVTPGACNITGTAADGAQCGHDAQCKSGYCKAQANATCGACAERSGNRGACTLLTDCSSGLICSQGTCWQTAASGAACGPHAPCGGTLACIGGTCQTPGAVGATCAAQTDCDQAHGIYCNIATNKCAQEQTAPAGQSCGVVSGALVLCSAAATCILPDGGTEGTCLAPAMDGASCDTKNGPGCLVGAACTGGTCTVPDLTGCH
jgi:hypothetical protein